MAPPTPYAIGFPRVSIYKETPKHKQLREGVRRFMDQHVVPHLETWEEEGHVPRELHKIAAKDPSGFYTMGIPEEYGGSGSEGCDAYCTVVLNEELVRPGTTGFAATLLTWGIGLPPILNHGSAALKQRVVPGITSGEKLICLCITEPWGGSDVQNIRTTAQDMGDHYIVNGTKSFITSGMRADYFTVATKTGKDALTGMTLLLLERGMPGIKTTAMKKMGWLCSDTAIVNFDNVKVPKANVIGSPGRGFMYVMTNFNHERLSLACQAVAGSRVCLEESIAYARQRKTFGRALVKNQGIRWKLMEMAKEVEASQAFLDILAHSLDLQRLGKETDPLLVAKLSLLKLHSTRTFEFVAREACQIFGGKSFLRTGPGAKVERLYREVRVIAIGGGSEEIMMELASRQSKL